MRPTVPFRVTDSLLGYPGVVAAGVRRNEGSLCPRNYLSSKGWPLLAAAVGSVVRFLPLPWAESNGGEVSETNSAATGYQPFGDAKGQFTASG